MTLKLMSDEFDEGGKIPDIYTCTGKDISPPVRWEGVPTNTESFVLIMLKSFSFPLYSQT